MAVPTTSMDGSRCSTCGISLRINAESSTTSTRIFLLMRWLPQPGYARDARPRAETFKIKTTVPSPRIEAPLTSGEVTSSIFERLDDQFFFAHQAVDSETEAAGTRADDDHKVRLARSVT